MIRTLKGWKGHLGLTSKSTELSEEAVEWLCFVRVGVMFSLILLLALQEIIRPDSLSGGASLIAYGILTAGFLATLLASFFLGDHFSKSWMVAAQVGVDSALISVWILLSQTATNLSALLYLIQILSVSLILYQRGAWGASLAACFGFGLASLSHTGPGGVSTWIVFSAIFVTVGLVGGYLSEELLRATQSLKEKSRKLEQVTRLHERILSNMPTGLLTVDRQMRINYINPAGAMLLGKTVEQLSGMTLEEQVPGLLPFFREIKATEIGAGTSDDDGDPAQRVEAEIGTGTNEGKHLFLHSNSPGVVRLQQRVELGEGKAHRIIRGDVAQLDAAAGLGRLLEQEVGGGRILLFQDVTKLLNLEERLKQNEKLAAVGQLAAGIAHEIRNPLASMSASIEMLREGIPIQVVGAENRKLMDIAIREIERLNRLISEFLDYVKPERAQMTEVNLKELISDLVLAGKRAKEFAKVKEVAETYDGRVIALANSEKLKQVVWNLLTNAAQAMPSGGTIRVGCATLPEGRVKFWVEDEGMGMTEKVLAHLYEPFFTTKERGTGLGLAVAYKIIEAHQGEIRVKSDLGKGTRFDVILNGNTKPQG